jgi:hypothetical protein
VLADVSSWYADVRTWHRGGYVGRERRLDEARVPILVIEGLARVWLGLVFVALRFVGIHVQ